ncbi:Berberine bridge enzyme-like 21, partial [Cucurbita argyrosperma subsp. argyrosperma]
MVNENAFFSSSSSPGHFNFSSSSVAHGDSNFIINPNPYNPSPHSPFNGGGFSSHPSQLPFRPFFAISFPNLRSYLLPRQPILLPCLELLHQESRFASPFVILDMFNLRSVAVNIEDESAVRARSMDSQLGFCPTVGVGGHLSGAGYGNLMRKFGVSVDNVVDALIVDANGRVLDRESMGEDLFWAIRGGGGASFGVIVSWKFKLVPLPETVSVFRIEKTMEEGGVDMLYKWQEVADKMDENLFTNVVILSVNKKTQKTAKAKLISLFLGSAQKLFSLMSETLPELGVKAEDCIETSWIESVLFWSNYRIGTPQCLARKATQLRKILEEEIRLYVQEPISKAELEGMMRKRMELKRPALTFNPYGGKMSEIAERETPFPHRAGNKYKIQYSVTWKEEGEEAADKYVGLIRELYEYMTPYVSKSPTSTYLNYRDVDLGVNGNGNASYWEASHWGRTYSQGQTLTDWWR